MSYMIGDRVLAQVDGSANETYLLTDGHGSTRLLTDSAATVTAAFNYDAFGGAIGFNPAVAPTIFLFGGDAVYDPASGLYLHGDGTRAREGFRFVQADLAQGHTQDPISLHKYVYAGDDPIMDVDRDGHDFSLASLSVSAGITGLISGILSTGIKAATNLWNGKPLGEGLWDSFFRGAMSTAITTFTLQFVGPYVANFTGTFVGGTLLDWFEGRFDDASGQFSSQTFIRDIETEAIYATVAGGPAGIGAAVSEHILEVNVIENMSSLIKVNRIGLAIDEGLGNILQKAGLKTIGKKILDAVEKRSAAAAMQGPLWQSIKQEASIWVAFSSLLKLANTAAQGLLDIFK